MWSDTYIDTHMHTRMYMRMTIQSLDACCTHGIHLSTPTHMHTYVWMCVIMHAVMLTGTPKSACCMDVWATWVLCGVAACTILRLWGIDCSLRWCTSFPWNDSIRLVLSMHILAAQSDVRAYVHTLISIDMHTSDAYKQHTMSKRRHSWMICSCVQAYTLQAHKLARPYTYLTSEAYIRYLCVYDVYIVSTNKKTRSNNDIWTFW
jgi:hypothetical protein